MVSLSNQEIATMGGKSTKGRQCLEMAGRFVFCPASAERENSDGFFMDTVYCRIAGPS